MNTGTDVRNDYTATGATRVFAFTFKVQSAADVEVRLGANRVTGGFIITTNADQAANPGGSVTFDTSPGSALVPTAVRLVRAVPYTQETVFNPYSPFPAKTTEGALDWLSMQIQQIRWRLENLIVEASSQAEEDAAIERGAKIVVRLDRLGVTTTTTAAPVTTSTTAAPTSTTSSTTTTTAPPDTAAPVITSFTVAASAAKDQTGYANVPITAWTHTDNVAVTGWYTSEAAIAPGPGAFLGVKPTSHRTSASTLTITIYAWVRDAAGNISSAANAACAITPYTTTTTAAPTTTQAPSAAPVFLTPADGASLSAPLTVSGTGVAGATIRIRWTTDGYVYQTTNVGPLAGTAWSYTLNGSNVGALTVSVYQTEPGKAESAAVVRTFTVAATTTTTAAPTTTTTAAPGFPTVTSMGILTSWRSLTVPLSAPYGTFAATDAVGVTGFFISESGATPAENDPGWVYPAPTQFVLSAGEGSRTFYGWAKNAAGNVSARFDKTILIDTVIPVVSTFTVPATSNSLTIPISSLTASDVGTGVTAFMVTESATAPGRNDLGWAYPPPASYTVATEGAKTLYAWAQDDVGNVSLGVSAACTVALPTTTTTTSSTTTTTTTAAPPTVADNFNRANELPLAAPWVAITGLALPNLTSNLVGPGGARRPEVIGPDQFAQASGDGIGVRLRQSATANTCYEIGWGNVEGDYWVEVYRWTDGVAYFVQGYTYSNPALYTVPDRAIRAEIAGTQIRAFSAPTVAGPWVLEFEAFDSNIADGFVGFTSGANLDNFSAGPAVAWVPVTTTTTTAAPTTTTTTTAAPTTTTTTAAPTTTTTTTTTSTTTTTTTAAPVLTPDIVSVSAIARKAWDTTRGLTLPDLTLAAGQKALLAITAINGGTGYDGTFTFSGVGAGMNQRTIRGAVAGSAETVWYEAAHTAGTYSGGTATMTGTGDCSFAARWVILANAGAVTGATTINHLDTPSAPTGSITVATAGSLVLGCAIADDQQATGVPAANCTLLAEDVSVNPGVYLLRITGGAATGAQTVAFSSAPVAADWSLGLVQIPYLAPTTTTTTTTTTAPPQLVADTFDRADAANLGANWSLLSGQGAGTMAIVSNQAAGTGPCHARWVTSLPSANHWAEAKTNGQNGGVSVRIDGIGRHYLAQLAYWFDGEGSGDMWECYIKRWDGASYATIASGVIDWSPHTILRLEANGSNFRLLTATQHGGPYTERLTATDATRTGTGIGLQGDAGLAYDSFYGDVL